MENLGSRKAISGSLALYWSNPTTRTHSIRSVKEKAALEPERLFHLLVIIRQETKYDSVNETKPTLVEFHL